MRSHMGKSRSAMTMQILLALETIRLAALVTLLFPVPAAASGDSLAGRPRWELYFKNGDRVRGDFLGIEAGRILWKYPGVPELIRFPLENAGEIRQNLPAPKHHGSHEGMVCLTNGDRLPGYIVGMDDKRVLLDTPFTGRLSLSRPMISEMSRAEAGTTLYIGPKQSDEWQSLDRLSGMMKNFEIRDETLILPPLAFAVCDVSLPDSAHISLTLDGFGQN
ncbi:MAG: hypothetical protein JW808_03160, partial [Victivallales bacterium]|nr:hypothetical protein [Victivallales bacterium]